MSPSKRTPHFSVLHNHSSGWFFAIFRKSSVRVGNINIHVETNLAGSQTPAQNLDDFHVTSLPRDSTPSIENITSVSITKSSTVALYGICFSVLKPCVYWRSDSSDAIVKCGSALFSDTIKCQQNPSKLFQNMLILMLTMSQLLQEPLCTVHYTVSAP